LIAVNVPVTVGKLLANETKAVTTFVFGSQRNLIHKIKSKLTTGDCN